MTEIKQLPVQETFTLIGFFKRLPQDYMLTMGVKPLGAVDLTVLRLASIEASPGGSSKCKECREVVPLMSDGFCRTCR